MIIQSDYYPPPPHTHTHIYLSSGVYLCITLFYLVIVQNFISMAIEKNDFFYEKIDMLECASYQYVNIILTFHMSMSVCLMSYDV